MTTAGDNQLACGRLLGSRYSPGLGLLRLASGGVTLMKLRSLAGVVVALLSGQGIGRSVRVL